MPNGKQDTTSAIPLATITKHGTVLLARLRAIAAAICEQEADENATIEEAKASHLQQGKAFTDPRNGITYFPAPRT